jgi:hypothetical protein
LFEALVIVGAETGEGSDFFPSKPVDSSAGPGLQAQFLRCRPLSAGAEERSEFPSGRGILVHSPILVGATCSRVVLADRGCSGRRNIVGEYVACES